MQLVTGVQHNAWRWTWPLGLATLGVLFLLTMLRPLPFALAAAPTTGETCFATPNNGTTVYSSTTAQAVRDAVGAAAPNSVVKLAGYCAGVQAQGGSTQVALITKTLTLAGGYTLTNWTTSYPVTQPTTLNAQNAGRVISATAALTLSGFTVQAGQTPFAERGGGLATFQAVTLTQMIFMSNTASFGDGGGAWVAGIAWVSDTLFLRNTGGGNYGGGAWFEGGGHVQNSTFLSNTMLSNGGGAYFGGPAFVTQTVFLSNTAQFGGAGGAMFLSAATLSNTQFLSNTAGAGAGGLYLNGPSTVVSLTVQGNRARDAGGAYLFNISGGAITLTNVIFRNNTATGLAGGAFINGATPKRFENGLFVGNQALTGTEIYNFNSIASLLHITLVGANSPTATALYVQGGSMWITNTLIASYTLGLRNVSGTVWENYNLFANTTTPYSGSVISGGHSLTGPVAFYDHTAYTLTAASYALDAGVNMNLPRDYFGNPRPQRRAVDTGYAESGYTFPLVLTLTAQPTHLFANGLDKTVLTVTATMTNGVPWAGQPVTLTTSPYGTFANSVMTLNANGVATTTYTVGIVPGTAPLTVTINDLGTPKIATTTVTLKPNPLVGTFNAAFAGQVLTYTFVVTNVDALTQTVTMSGSAPSGASLIAVTGGITVATGGDYGFGYAEASNIVLAPNASYTLQWTIQFIGFTGDVDNQAHAESTTARLRLPALLRIYRQLLMPVYRP